MYKGEQYNIKEYFNISNINDDKLVIILRGIGNITDMNYIFSDCNLLSSLFDITQLNTISVNNMGYLFNNCYSLKKVLDISKWNTSNVTNMSNLFNNCSSLNYKILP